MTSLPLLAVDSPRAVVAWRAGRPVMAAHFLAQAQALAVRLPPGRHVLNTCGDRHAFTVAFAASLIAGRTSLLPSSTAPFAMRRLRETTPDLVCMTDEASCDLDCPVVQVSQSDDDFTPSGFDIPRIDKDHVAALVYTSGSTGDPVGHPKTWGTLVRCLQAGATRLGLDGRPHSLVATVPPQHMYGFELSVLLPWVGGHAACAERPLHAAEVAAVLESVPAPRVLVTTPVHLRALLASAAHFPALELVVSATAPLGQQLARESEQRFGAPLREIYGSTETGEMAMRRTAQEVLWELWPGIRLEVQGDTFIARGGHIDAPTPLQDLVTPVSEQYFLLQGRRTDLVNIAGKRSSLGYLNHALHSIPGVVDGSFVMRPDGGLDAGVMRLAALVVAPGLTTAQLMDELRLRIDATFLPRPLLLLDRLPRSATGKLPLAAVEALLGAPRGGSS